METIRWVSRDELGIQLKENHAIIEPIVMNVLGSCFVLLTLDRMHK